MQCAVSDYQINLIIQHSKQRKMGCCESRLPAQPPAPINVLRKRYGVLQLNNHFLAKIQIEYLKIRRAEYEALMLEHSERIVKERMAEIDKKQELAEARFQQPLQIARADPQKARQSEVRYNMSLEEMIGLEGMRRKFEELKGIVTKNAKKTDQEMIEDVRLRFELMQSRLRQKIINVEVVQVKEEDLRKVEEDFRKSRTQEIKIYENQVEEQINKRISFDNYTKRYIYIVPQEELMTLASESSLPEMFRKEPEMNQVQQNHICCWCL